MDLYIDAAAAEYDQPDPQTRKYAGLHAIEIDGAIQRVDWQLGGGQASTTTVSRNLDAGGPTTPGFKELQVRMKNKRARRNAVDAGVDAGGMMQAGPRIVEA